mgnify:CR=1 FL=1
MDWIDETLAHIEGTEELRTVARSFLEADVHTRNAAITRLWEFTSSLEGEEKTKFTVMATILETASAVLQERMGE